MSSYLETAKAAMNFINTRKKQGPEGIYWSLQDAAEGRKIYYDEICMYAGASGIICFLLGLYDAAKDESYLEEAEEAAKYIIYRWHHDRSLKRNFSQYAFSSGWSGAGFALTRLYLATGKQEYEGAVASIIEQAQKDAKPGAGGLGYSWSSFPGIVGDAGTVLFLLFAADTYKREDWKQFAIESGKNFFGQRREAGDGKYWYQGVDPAYFGAKDDYIDPNFPMGTAGIGFTLLKLYETSGDKEFWQMAQGVPEFMDSVAVKIRLGRLLPHGLPDRGNLFYLGYCHGPAGTNRFLYELYKQTDDEIYKKRIDELVQGVRDMGAPKERSEGFWNTDNICCGTAGLLNMYLGLWAAFGEDVYYQEALKCGEVLLKDAEFSTENGVETARWPFALDRVSPDQLSTPIGCFDGAAGIGLALLQLYQAEKGQFHTVRMIDDPFPEEKLG